MPRSGLRCQIGRIVRPVIKLTPVQWLMCLAMTRDQALRNFLLAPTNSILEHSAIFKRLGVEVEPAKDGNQEPKDDLDLEDFCAKGDDSSEEDDGRDI